MKHKEIKALVPVQRVDLGPGDQWTGCVKRLYAMGITDSDHPNRYCGVVCLDSEAVLYFEEGYNTESEARAAAQAYVDELIKHFREGGE